MTETTRPQETHQGCDAPVKRREDDHLNRWPLAREIYGIAVTGPSDWSVRVGVYGEWGTGKTSVLEFIAAMAAKDDHVIIWFDPWEHSTKQDLWRSFVLTVFEELEKKLGGISAAGTARQKAWIEKAKGVAVAITGAFNATAGTLAESGLELVKKHFSFSQEDLASLQGLLGTRRVIVLIDDLDRTAPELVPEILFALKELMDVPGFSFVSAFDPVVVGKVLRQYHRGFGDGLKFLEKIIDYPRWLPPASPEGLSNLAVAESKRFCRYVPEQALRDAMRLLPSNPRSVRQFIRLLALLKPQIERHNEEDLYWPVILAANVIKVRYPRIAHELLRDASFWTAIDHTSLMARDRQERSKIDAAIDEHVKQVTGKLGVSLEIAERDQIKAALKVLCSHINPWALRNEKFILYQMEIAENPEAVTSKELAELIEAWTAKPSADTVKAWIAGHAERAEFSQERVFRESLMGTLDAFAKALNSADNTLIESEKASFESRAEALMALLECLVFELARLDQDDKRIGIEELRRLCEVVSSLAGAKSPVHSRFWPRSEGLLLRAVEVWKGDVTPLMEAVHPYYPDRFARRYEGGDVRKLHRKLTVALLPKFGRQVVDGFRQSGFVERLFRREAGTVDTRNMILTLNGPLWSEWRHATFSVLAEATTNRVVQENAYELLYWFDYMLRQEQSFQDTAEAKALLLDGEAFNAIWSAATASQLGIHATFRLKSFVEEAQKLGIEVMLPPWWGETLARVSQRSDEQNEAQASQESQ